MTIKLVLLRHGHSEWNLTNRFTGWTDIPLTQTGLEEAELCGRKLYENNLEFDEVHISALYRTRQTADYLLRAANHKPIPILASWRLNERHYGSLQGLRKSEIFEQWGEQQSFRWWRGFFDAPPALSNDDPRHPRFDTLYQNINPEELPGSESLQQCQQRLLIYWHNQLIPKLSSGKRLLIISHGNTLRALRMYIEDISAELIEQVEIPAAIPMIYYLDNNLKMKKIDWLNENDVDSVW